MHDGSSLDGEVGLTAGAVVLGGLASGFPGSDGVAVALGAANPVGPPAADEPRFGLGVVAELLQCLNEADTLAVGLAGAGLGGHSV